MSLEIVERSSGYWIVDKSGIVCDEPFIDLSDAISQLNEMEGKTKMSDIVVEFSGWIVADPDKTKFFKVGEQDERPDIIDGKQWLALDESERSDYILDNVIDAQRHSVDGDYSMIDIEERGMY